MGNHVGKRSWIATSATTLDRGEDTYLALIGKLLAAIVATLLGASLILAGALGFARDSEVELVASTAGVLLVLLALEQAWQVTRKLD